jgi:uncharacterized membrane protein HdeD (DUF308 family)
MFDILIRNWWMLVIRGLAAIVFGLMALIWPGIPLIVLVVLFGAYALVDGAVALGSVTAIVEPSGAGRAAAV